MIDVYAKDLKTHGNGVSIEDAHLDKSGYYAQARPDPVTGHPKERQLDFFGGLRWRYEEHIPERSRKIDRIALFRAKPELRLRDDHTFTDEEYNTYACPWHHNLTAAICSFRTAKALKRNPGSRFDIDTFSWHNSVPFEWHSRRLLDLGPPARGLGARPDRRPRGPGAPRRGGRAGGRRGDRRRDRRGGRRRGRLLTLVAATARRP